MNRRHLLLASAGLLSGCKILDEGTGRNVLASANGLSYRAQRFLGGGTALAPEYSMSDIRQSQHPNGVTNPEDLDYQALAAGDFADYRLSITGLVENPISFTRQQLINMPSRTQITRHDCVEGWSCIAKWTGVPLSLVLNQARPQISARFAVFKCFDTIEKSLSGGIKYYESIDLIDAYHPQTILAYGVNDQALPVANGAPLRLRVERQLGYKMAKYVHTIELTDRLPGNGGYWEDNGYDWYAGI